MKLTTIILGLFVMSFAFAGESKKCEMPAGEYTGLEMVLDQFVRYNANPNWGDWCYEGEIADRKPCADELDAWDTWLTCTGLEKVDKHCRSWVEKEGFTAGLSIHEHEAAVAECRWGHYKDIPGVGK